MLKKLYKYINLIGSLLNSVIAFRIKESFIANEEESPDIIFIIEFLSFLTHMHIALYIYSECINNDYFTYRIIYYNLFKSICFLGSDAFCLF